MKDDICFCAWQKSTFVFVQELKRINCFLKRNTNHCFNQCAGGRLHMQTFFVPPIGERLNTHSDFCVFWRLTCQHTTRGVT